MSVVRVKGGGSLDRRGEKGELGAWELLWRWEEREKGLELELERSVMLGLWVDAEFVPEADLELDPDRTVTEVITRKLLRRTCEYGCECLALPCGDLKCDGPECGGLEGRVGNAALQ